MIIRIKLVDPDDISSLRTRIFSTMCRTCDSRHRQPSGMYSEQYSAAPSGSGPKQRGRKSMMVSLSHSHKLYGPKKSLTGAGNAKCEICEYHVLLLEELEMMFADCCNDDALGTAQISQLVQQ